MKNISKIVTRPTNIGMSNNGGDYYATITIFQCDDGKYAVEVDTAAYSDFTHPKIYDEGLSLYAGIKSFLRLYFRIACGKGIQNYRYDMQIPLSYLGKIS